MCLDVSGRVCGMSGGCLDMFGGCLDVSRGCLDMSGGCLDVFVGQWCKKSNVFLASRGFRPNTFCQNTVRRTSILTTSFCHLSKHSFATHLSWGLS